ncbi:MAG TPA: hypothetical protein VEN79_01695, partial [Terriglobia bacterium]|nr:hypothetical protein [Terriglobia bacterium]
NLAAAFFAALTVGALRFWLPSPDTASRDFTFLCITCGLGSVAYLATLAALQAIPMAQLGLLWSRENVP